MKKNVLIISCLLLISCGSGSSFSQLFSAVERDDLEGVLTLLREGANPNERRSYPLLSLNMHGGDYYDPHNGFTVLMSASTRGSLPIVEALLNEGAKPNSSTRNGSTALMFAARRCHLDVMKLLLAHGADITAVATGGGNYMGGDFSGSVLRFSLLCALWKEGTPEVARFVLDRLKPGDIPNTEINHCLDWRHERVPSDIKVRIESLRQR